MGNFGVGDEVHEKLICNSFRAKPQPFKGLSKSLKGALFGQQMPVETLHMVAEDKMCQKAKQHEHL